MGISTQTISQAAQAVANQSLTKAVTVANATLVAQQTISDGTTTLLRAALADNSTVTLSETKVSFDHRPFTVFVDPIEPGQLQISPPNEGSVPNLEGGVFPTITDVPGITNLFTARPGAMAPVPGIQGDLVVPGGMVRLEDVKLGGVRAEASPKAPQVTVPVLSTSGSESGSQPSLESASQEYVQVVLVGSVQSIGQSATQGDTPPGP